MRFLLIVSAIFFHVSFLHAGESSYKFTFGSNLGNIPLEINKINKNKKILSGIKINSWILKPNFLSFIGDKKNSDFLEDKSFKEILYIKFNFKF